MTLTGRADGPPSAAKLVRLSGVQWSAHTTTPAQSVRAAIDFRRARRRRLRRRDDRPGAGSPTMCSPALAWMEAVGKARASSAAVSGRAVSDPASSAIARVRAGIEALSWIRDRPEQIAQQLQVSMPPRGRAAARHRCCDRCVVGAADRRCRRLSGCEAAGEAADGGAAGRGRARDRRQPSRPAAPDDQAGRGRYPAPAGDPRVRADPGVVRRSTETLAPDTPVGLMIPGDEARARRVGR